MSVWDDHIIPCAERSSTGGGVSNSSVNENERLRSIVSQLPHQMEMSYLSFAADLGLLFLVPLWLSSWEFIGYHRYQETICRGGASWSHFVGRIRSSTSGRDWRVDRKTSLVQTTNFLTHPTIMNAQYRLPPEELSDLYVGVGVSGHVTFYNLISAWFHERLKTNSPCS